MSTESRSIRWYRTPLPPDEIRKLYQRSDFLGGLQTLGYLGLLVLTGALACYSSFHWPIWLTIPILYLHGTCFAFQINAVHELGHHTVFNSRKVNRFFMLIFSFLGWINPYLFFASHQRHHQSTLHPPDDLEVVVPMDMTWPDFWKSAIINYGAPRWVLAGFWRIAMGRFEGDWELTLFPPDEPERRQPAIVWARIVLAGQLGIAVACAATGWWMGLAVITLAPFYGKGLFLSCNQTQHIGLTDFQDDFRICCRTFLPNPIVRFLYWHMNYHTEHHMYVGVPCYHLGKLHRMIKHDLPPTPVGILSTWREILRILVIQREDPNYRYCPPLPSPRVETTTE